MTSISFSVWLPLFALIYIVAMLFWARRAVTLSGGGNEFFSAGHQLSPWISALILGGASLGGWFLLGGSRDIAHYGFRLPALLTAGITLALTGTVFFKRVWFVAERLRVSSQAELFRAYYNSPFLVVVSAAVALTFALGFSGLQLRALAHAVAALTDGAISPLTASVVLGFVLFAGAGIGGMRSIGYFGVLQTVLAFTATLALAVFALIYSGGFAALNAGLLKLASVKETASLFLVDGVIHFDAGLGRGGDPAKARSAIASLGLAFAFMGFQASPLAIKVILSTRSPNGIAAGQTWVLAGCVGALLAFGVAVIGAAGMVSPDLSLDAILNRMTTDSPWFAAWIFTGIAAGVLLTAGLGLFVAAETLVRHIYKPYFHAALSRQATVALTRITIAVLALVVTLMQVLSPVTVSALAALALPAAFQLWTPLLGITWLGWISRPAATVGVGFGLAAVVLTEALGHDVLSFLGLELPWGRWPWTAHSALWGIVVNAVAVIIISAITDRSPSTPEAAEVRKLFAGPLAVGPRARSLRATAWSVTLGWFFLAVGPGVLFGNSAFSIKGADGPVWLLGMPSIWAWSLGAWISGLGLIWFLAYKMELASPSDVTLPAYVPKPRLARDRSAIERERLRGLVIVGAACFALTVLITFGFGGHGG